MTRRKPCFKPNIKWPCLYDLRMLAHSKSWRNENNILLLSNSVNQLLSFAHSDKMIYTYKKGQFVGPCFAFINQQLQILKLTDIENYSLDTMELLARCGLISRVKLLKDKYDYLLSLINKDLTVNIKVDKKKDHGWSPYFGFALSENWKKQIDVHCDILFRILLIMVYTENN